MYKRNAAVGTTKRNLFTYKNLILTYYFFHYIEKSYLYDDKNTLLKNIFSEGNTKPWNEIHHTNKQQDRQRGNRTCNRNHPNELSNTQIQSSHKINWSSYIIIKNAHKQGFPPLISALTAVKYTICGISRNRHDREARKITLLHPLYAHKRILRVPIKPYKHASLFIIRYPVRIVRPINEALIFVRYKSAQIAESKGCFVDISICLALPLATLGPSPIY